MIFSTKHCFRFFAKCSKANALFRFNFFCFRFASFRSERKFGNTLLGTPHLIFGFLFLHIWGMFMCTFVFAHKFCSDRFRGHFATAESLKHKKSIPLSWRIQCHIKNDLSVALQSGTNVHGIVWRSNDGQKSHDTVFNIQSFTVT
jgi:hypothetical protein